MTVRRTRAAAFVAAALFTAVAWYLRGSAQDLAVWWNGGTGRLQRLVVACLSWSAAGAAAACLAGAFTAGWWARPWPAVRPDAASGRAPRWLVAVLAVLTVAGACVRAPRLGLSLYNDEAYVFRRHLAGMVPVRDSGRPEAFREATWLEALYDNRQGNNSPVFTVLSRTSLQVWGAATGAGPWVVHEPAMRFPVLLCGSLAIAATGWLAFRLAGPFAGAAAAFLAACHPWHVRYSVEARCYGILLLILPLLWLALHRALVRGTWRAWALFGLMELLTLSCFFGAAFFLAALNLALAGVVLAPVVRKGARLRDAAGSLVPAVVCGAGAVCAYLLLHLPLFVQLAKLTRTPGYLQGSITPAWVADAASYLVFGFPGTASGPADPLYPSVGGLLGSHPWGAAAAVAAAAFVFGRGALRLVRTAGAASTIPAAAVGGLAVAIGYCLIKGITLLPWYSIFALPGVLVVLAAGVTPARPQSARAWIPVPVAVVPIAALWAVILPAYLSRSREDLRGAMEAAHGGPYREWVYPAESRPLVASFWSEAPVYDLSAIPIGTGADLDALVERARGEGRELFVEFGFPREAAATMPELMAALTESGRFERAAVRPGLDTPDSTHTVYRLRP